MVVGLPWYDSAKATELMETSKRPASKGVGLFSRLSRYDTTLQNLQKTTVLFLKLQKSE